MYRLGSHYYVWHRRCKQVGRQPPPQKKKNTYATYWKNRQNFTRGPSDNLTFFSSPTPFLRVSSFTGSEVTFSGEDLLFKMYFLLVSSKWQCPPPHKNSWTASVITICTDTHTHTHTHVDKRYLVGYYLVGYFLSTFYILCGLRLHLHPYGVLCKTILSFVGYFVCEVVCTI